MPDRLDELRKQRALVQQHLTWLDHEIAAVTVTRLTLPPFAMRSSTRPPIAPTATTPSIPLGSAKPVVVPELSEFQVNPDEVQGDTRKGCIMYAALAFLVLVLILVVIYFVGYRDNPVLFVPDKADSKIVYPAGTPQNPPPAKKNTPPPVTPPSR
jgi:hypothetical protein